MREIKFRAWDKTRNIYGEVLELHRPYGPNDSGFPEGHKGRISLFNLKNEYDCGFWGLWIEKADLEQYTGLHDKNGKEIYEGDILESFRSKYTYPIEYDVDCCAFVAMKPHTFLPPEAWRNCEIVGNIHENPELLK